MTRPEFASFPVYNVDADSVKCALNKVEVAMEHRDYRQVSESALVALDQIQVSFMAMLDLRAYALGMQGKFNEAIKSAQRMITCEPTLATGYLRLGDLYGIQGKQLDAIDAYDLGLQSASADHADYAQLIDGKESAIKRSQTRVDFVARLPIEIVDDTITLLPNKSKFVLLTISSIWRNKIFRCSSVWKTLSNDTSDDGIASVIPHIAAHVEDLTIATTDRRVFLRYILGLTGGNFSKIKSLTMDENCTSHIDAPMTVPVSGAFWQIRNTLTRLVLHFHQDSAVITLVDLLTSCSNIQSLEYSAPYSRLSDTIGELVLLNPHNALVDMQLTAQSITGTDIQKLFPCCQQVKRLILYACDITVLDVVDTVCPNLRTFGFNSDLTEIQRLDDPDTNHPSPGLRQLYTNNGGTGVPAEAILPLIRRNMNSLKVLYGNISDGSSTRNLGVQFADIELENLSKLIFWGTISGLVQGVLLRSISACSALTRVEVIDCRHIKRLVDALVALPPLEFLGISHSKDEIGEADLQRLFEYYAKYSPSARQFKATRLRDCPTIVTDDVVIALADIKTLEQIWFRNLSSVSSYGMHELLKKRCNSMVDIRLTEMDMVTDNTLSTIGNVKNLRSIHLERLRNVTDLGIINLLSGAQKLESFTLEYCSTITSYAIAYAKQKVKNVVIVK
ncbi:hypothetical protein BJV82DRAFT_299440 [Fennellomyces sp. T-0311]|nr:hypothetical protein BJV82DRAFT_299440 [Fennellomyces sp. T-0311]